MSETILQELLDHRAILELKARFVRTVDAKDWVGYREIFSPDGIFDFGGALPRAQLPDRILGGPEVLRDQEYIGAVTARN